MKEPKKTVMTCNTDRAQQLRCEQHLQRQTNSTTSDALHTLIMKHTATTDQPDQAHHCCWTTEPTWKMKYLVNTP